MVVVAFFLAAFSAGLAVVLVTRPDLVVERTLGWSTTAGAAVEALRGLAVLALGLPAAFLVVVPAFLVVALAAGFSAFSVFLAAAFLGAAAFVAVVAFLAAGLAAGSFLASFTGPEGPLG